MNEKYYKGEAREKALDRCRGWYQKNKARTLERNNLWIQENPEKRKEQRSRFYAKHRDRILRERRGNRKNLDYYKKYYQENKQAYILKARVRRSRLAGAEGSFTLEEWRQLVAHHNAKCLSCGSVEKLTPDHVIPIVKDGSNTIDNIQPLCLGCNLRKATKIIDYRIDYVS